MDVFAPRLDRVRAAMAERGVDALLLSTGADLPWLCGYEAMPLERLTMLVVRGDEPPTLVVPRLEAPRVAAPGWLAVLPWDEVDDPVASVAGLLAPTPAGATVAIGDRTWSRFVLALQSALPGARWLDASAVVGPLRAVKDAAEVAALARAADAADRVVAALQAGEVPLVGRSEAAISDELGRRLVAEGHARVNFAIVAAGAAAASPHHEPGSRTVVPGDVVLCDIGGTMVDEHGVGYCSDITRCVAAGGVEPPSEIVAAYEVLQRAQAAGVAAAVVGASAQSVDAAARGVIEAAGWGPQFIHRTGHGIGVEAHEDPYLVAGNDTPLEAGHAFSVEPGIYLDGRWGLRLEDIVVADEAGPRSLNQVDHALVVVDA